MLNTWVFRAWKWFVFGFVLFLAILAAAIKQHDTRQKYEAQSQADCIALATSPEEKHSCAQQAQSRKDYAQWWYVLVTWPEGITTWAIIATGFVIGWQSHETRKAAEASRKSLEVQEAEFVQWLDMGDWSVERDPEAVWVKSGGEITTHPGAMKVRISFPLVNNTIRPLFIRSVRTNLVIGVDREHSTFITEEAKPVPPKEEYRVVIDVVFSKPHVTSYLMFGMPIEAVVHVRLFNAINKPEDSFFQRLIFCKGGEETRTVTKGHVSKRTDY